MPYKDKEAKKQYYERHKKHYEREYKIKNKAEWNEYQKMFKVEARRKHVEKIKAEVKDMNISSEEDATYRAAVILFLIAATGLLKPWALSYRTGYDAKEVTAIIERWKRYDILVGSKFLMEDISSEIEFVLICMLGAGEIVRTREGKVGLPKNK